MATKSNPPAYDHLIDYFYKAGFPSVLGGNATAVAHAIMRKWNVLIRPSEFTMTNKELEWLTGIDTHIGRWRQKVIDNCKVERSPLFTYVSNGRKRAGTYRINTNLLPNNYQTNTNLLPNGLHNVNINKEKERKEKKEPLQPHRPKGSLRDIPKEKIDDLREAFVKEVRYNETEFDSEISRYGYEFMYECWEIWFEALDNNQIKKSYKGYMKSIISRRWESE